MDMQEQLRKIQEEAANQLENVRDKAGLDALRLKMLGKKGDLTLMLRSMGQLPAEERPKAGQMINVVREKLTEQMDALDAKIKRIEQEKKLEREAIDVTEPRRHAPIGTIHPVSLVQDQLLKVFTGMGFDVVEGPEVELDLFNFELLNLPKNHPARDMQDTLYITERVLMRTHTSPVQVRTMLGRKPPLAIVAPGKVYRRDSDLTHTPMFHQVEGLVVGQNISMAHLRGTLTAFVRSVFGGHTEVRFRPSFFPFTEPSCEMDVQCHKCGGKGCSVCKHVGWIEIMPGGTPHPNVLRAAGLDPDEYTGFYVNIGLDRLVMMRYGVDDVRLFHSADLRFLKQFH